MSPQIIAGLYSNTKSGINQDVSVIKKEIINSLKVNPWYRDHVRVLAGDCESADFLERNGLKVYKIFNDAPDFIKFDTVHLMKHWMCIWAVKT
jgi:hypothetical protein